MNKIQKMTNNFIRALSNYIGIVVLGSYYEEIEEGGEYTTCYFSSVLHQIRFTPSQLRYIRAHGYDNVA